ncbi:hypothetical protein [Abyssalbus ytuae]|uniref:Uncharacterized protein n=1 Tax=Abyssalbus ytuae TaxID=2926907 RepID=A0A9E6ZPC1_9FLAO|nr:hypothetical protein [Abyssalbus ytuae]UOB16278.1 hypothetical protein MQE35_11070 [Abyssalbus ytuae]
MFKTSILKAKIKRSSVDFKNTYFWNSETSPRIIDLFFSDGEEIILFYIQSKNYSWILTNTRLIFPSQMQQIRLSELVNVSFDTVKNDPNQKMSNNKLTLHTLKDTTVIFVEEGTWHLLYEVFKFIIVNNKE